MTFWSVRVGHRPLTARRRPLHPEGTTPRPLVAALILAVAVLAGCGGNGGEELKLDGTPRYPDDEGVLMEVSESRIILGPGRRRSYELSPRLRSFSTYTRQLEPIAHRRGQYVQVGVDDGTAVWVAGVAAVLAGPPAAVYYTGYLVRVDGDRRAIFQDGTVLRLGAGTDVPVRRGFVQAEIDPENGRVRRLMMP